MSLFDLLLILIVLSTAVGLVTVVIAALLRRWKLSLRILVGIVAIWAVYLAAGTGIALITPQRVMAIGEDRCFDEMCFAVMGFRRARTIESDPAISARGNYLIVDVRISNRSHGRAEREAGRKAVVLDQMGHVYEVSRQGQESLSKLQGTTPGLDAEVGPGQSVNTNLVFDLPVDINHPALALDSGLAFNPSWIVIGDEMHFLHKPTIVRLE
jgi:hypothetical protein